MKKFLRVLSVTLALAMVLVASVLGVMATVESTAVVYGDRVNLSGNTTSTFDVGFQFRDNNTAIEVGKINLSWDAQKITATQIVAEGALTADGVDFVSTIDNENGKATVAWVGSSIGSDVASGDLFNVTFDKSNLSEEDIVSIAVEVESLGYSALFVPYNVAETVTASAAVATSGEVGAYTGSTEEDAIAWINSLIAAAEFGDVEAKIASDLVFSSSASYTKINFGTAGSVPTGTISFSSEGTDANGKPFGFVVDSKTILNFYANLAFNNIKLDGTNAWTSGGCIQVTEGSAIYGVNDEGQNYGNIYVPTNNDRMNISGANLEVYTGKYRAVCGNFYNTGLTVTNPTITVGGNTTGQYIIGSSHNGKNTVEGPSTVVVGGTAGFTNVLAGSWCSGGVGVNGGTLTVNDNPTVEYLIASCVGDTKEVNPVQYVMTVNGGNFDYVTNHMYTTVGSATINAKTIFNGGSVEGYVMGGSLGQWKDTSVAYVKNKTTNTLAGTTELVINADPGSKILGGSYMLCPDSIHSANSKLVIDGVELGDEVYGGSYLSTLNTSKDANGVPLYLKRYGSEGAYTYHNCENATHSGDVSVVIKNGAKLKHPDYDPDDATNKKKAIAFYTGSYISAANSTHTGNVTLDIYVDEGNDAEYSFYTYDVIYGGSYVKATGGSHTGRVKATIDKAIVNVVSDSWGGIVTGPIVTNGSATIANTETEKGIELTLTNSQVNKRIAGGYIGAAADYTADTLITIGEGNTLTGYVFGGVSVTKANGRFVGDSKVVLDLGTGSFTALAYGGSYLSVAGGSHVGNSEIDVLSGTIAAHPNGTSDAYGIYGGSSISNKNITHKGNSTLKLTGVTTVARCLFGGSYISGSNVAERTHEGNSYLYLNSGTVTTGSLLGGSYITGSRADHIGDSYIVVNGTQTSVSVYAGSKLALTKSTHVGNSSVTLTSGKIGGTAYGGSYAASQSTEHIGNGAIYLNGGSITGTAYGGSFLTSNYANHRGDSRVEIAKDMSKDVYGGTRIYQELTNQYGNSEVVVHSGKITGTIYGGSQFPAKAQDDAYTKTVEYGHIGGSGIVFKSGTYTASYIWGGSNLNTDGASVATGYAIHGIRYQAADGENPEVKASKTYIHFEGGTFTGKGFYGGAYCGKTNTKMYGDIEIIASGSAQIKVSERIASLYAVNGNNEFYGNSKIEVIDAATLLPNGTKVGAVIAGAYGSCIMYGDSTLRLDGTKGIGSFGDGPVVTAGCYGTNDISTTAGNRTTPYGGYRQTGNVYYIMSGSSYNNTYTSIGGYRSNVDGNIIIDISGNATTGSIPYGLCRYANKTQYVSCSGDVRAYLSGTPTLKYGISLGSNQATSETTGMPAGVNVILGDVYMEISGNIKLTSTSAADGNGAHQLQANFIAPNGDTIIKMVGDAKITVGASSAENLGIYFHRYATSVSRPAKRILDLTQYTGPLESNGMPPRVWSTHADPAVGGIEILKPIKDANLSFDASSLNVGDAFSSIIADEYTYNDQTITYANLTQYDEKCMSPNAFKFYSEATGKEIKNLEFATSNVIVKCGDIQIGTITLEAIGNAVAEETFALESNFMFTGNSFRMPDPSRGRTLALRCRAYVDPTFLGEYATLKNGFKIAEIGMLVSVKPTYSTTEMVYGGAGISKAVAYKDGECVIDGGWDVVDGKYYYAAAITGYEDQNGVIAERVVASIYTRAYIVYADANGDTLVYYYDLPESASAGEIISGEGFNQYRTSLYDRAAYEKDRQTGNYQTYMSKFEEILACKQA